MIRQKMVGAGVNRRAWNKWICRYQINKEMEVSRHASRMCIRISWDMLIGRWTKKRKVLVLISCVRVVWDKLVTERDLSLWGAYVYRKKGETKILEERVIKGGESECATFFGFRNKTTRKDDEGTEWTRSWVDQREEEIRQLN